MVKSSIVFIFLIVTVQAEDIYARNCIPCHKNLPTSLEQMFMSYLAAYSGETNVKSVLRFYLNKPTKSITVMSDLFIDNYGVKKPTTLTKEELDEAIDIYWEKFKVFDKLK
jgi:hypothetical protein